MGPRKNGEAMVYTTEHSSEYYQQMENDLNVLELTQRVYGRGSENMLGLVKRFWYQYCQFTKKNPVATLKGISINVLYAFFDWLLRERKGSLGAASSLQTYWNALCIVRKQETGYHQIDPLIKSQMHGVRQRLANAHGLRKDKKKKPVLHAEDEFELLKTLYTSTETTFPHERYRVQLALIMQLAIHNILPVHPLWINTIKSDRVDPRGNNICHSPHRICLWYQLSFNIGTS